LELYVDGNRIGDGLAVTTFDVTTPLARRIGSGRSGAQYANGIIDEVRISNIVRSAGWIDAEFNNQNTPATFVIEGTPESPGKVIPVFMSFRLRQMGV